MPHVKCKICGQSFYAKPNWLDKGWGKYCSAQCKHEAQKTGKFVKCEVCGKKIWRKQSKYEHSKSGKFFCNKAHQAVWRNSIFIGEKHANWKGGENIRHKEYLIRCGEKLKCKICKCTDSRVLLVHHIDRNRRNNKQANLIFLCFNCHHLVHNYGIRVSK